MATPTLAVASRVAASVLKSEHRRVLSSDKSLFDRLTKRYDQQPYRLVRRKLIALGYRPVRFGWVSADEDPSCPYESARKAHNEVIACSGTGLGFQELAFYRPAGAGYAVVVAYGEEGLRVAEIRAATASDLRTITEKRKAVANYKPPFPSPDPCPPKLCWKADGD